MAHTTVSDKPSLVIHPVLAILYKSGAFLIACCEDRDIHEEVATIVSHNPVAGIFFATFMGFGTLFAIVFHALFIDGIVPVHAFFASPHPTRSSARLPIFPAPAIVALASGYF